MLNSLSSISSLSIASAVSPLRRLPSSSSASASAVSPFRRLPSSSSSAASSSFSSSSSSSSSACSASSSASSASLSSSSFPATSRSPPPLRRPAFSLRPMSFLGFLGLGSKGGGPAPVLASSVCPVAQGPDDDVPEAGQLFAQFGAGCFWGVELAFQRVPGVTRTEVGYSQGVVDNPTYNDVCAGTTAHSEVVRVQYQPSACKYDDLLHLFWSRHDPTTLNRQGGDVGTQYRSGIYFYTPEQEKAARESLDRHQNTLKTPIVTEILPAKKFYRAEEYHQQYLAKGGRFGFKQSTDKGCNDPIRCYG